MPKLSVPSAADVAKKFVEVTPARAPYYASETPKAAAEWESDTIAAGGVFKAAVTATNIDKLFLGGVKKAGAAKFRRKVETVGKDRYGPGVEASLGDMQSGIAPYLDEMGKIDIKERGPRGATGNYDIPKQIGDPLHKRRLAELAASV